MAKRRNATDIAPQDLMPIPTSVPLANAGAPAAGVGATGFPAGTRRITPLNDPTTGTGGGIRRSTPAAPTTATGQTDARSIITNLLRGFGLQTLDKWAWQLVTKGATADMITDELYQQPLFKARFPGIFIRQEKGLPAISPADYVTLEDDFYNLIHQYGLPASVLTPSFIGEQLIGNDVSPSEIQDRIVKGYAMVADAPASVQQTFKQWFGAAGTGQLAGFFLNPKNNADTLMKEAQMANIQGAGINAGVNIGKNRATQLAAMGDTYAQISSQLNKLTQTAGLYQANQQEGFENRPVRGATGQAYHLTESNQGVNAALGLSAAAEQEVEQRGLERLNAFRGGGGAAQTPTQGYIGLGAAKAF